MLISPMGCDDTTTHTHTRTLKHSERILILQRHWKVSLHPDAMHKIREIYCANSYEMVRYMQCQSIHSVCNVDIVAAQEAMAVLK